MKAAVVTFVRAYNYGAVLQCYALCDTLRKNGIEAETIDYYPDYFKAKYSYSYIGDARYFPYRPLKSWLKFIPVLRAIEKRNNAFDSFIKNKIPLTNKQYYSLAELNNERFNYDLFVSGSDQVWNDRCANFDPVYFLQFDSASHSKKASYAASFGFAQIPDGYREEYEKRLSDWDLYSVRESKGVSILQDLLGVESTQCCDPTLLLTKSDWDKIKSNKRVKKPYILIYSVDNGRNQLFDYAQQLAKSKNLDVINLPCSLKYDIMMGYEAKKLGFSTMNTVDPGEWISLFADADYVLTDSFHGTVFSALYHKSFLSLADYKWGENSRIKELLGKLSLSDRIIKNNTDSIDNPIEWESVDNILESSRRESLSYINSLKSLGE